MSYLMSTTTNNQTHSRQFDPQQQQQQQQLREQHPTASSDHPQSSHYPHQSLPPQPPQPPAAFDYQSAHLPQSDLPEQDPPMPKIGQTRCYWALLSSELQFIYLDPVLAHHLEEQAEALVGKSLLSFVHPDEQASAKHDLGSVLESRTLHGSVTRVRYSRLSRVRRQLGHDAASSPWSDAEKVALDLNYMAVDIVINWAAEGLVLCFIHAIVDLNPLHDNDERHKTGWSNWCGTPSMKPEQIDLLYRRLLMCIPQTGNMNRVFQMLANTPDRTLLMSWPPDPANAGANPGGQQQQQQQQQQQATGRDFARLVEEVQIGTGLQSGNDAKTSCTRRYKATQQMPPSIGGEVESIFIPHGTVIFACHKVTPRAHPLAYNSTAAYPTSQQQPYYDNEYAASLASNYPGYGADGQHPPPSDPSYPSQPWAPNGAPSGPGGNPSDYPAWNTSGMPPPSSRPTFPPGTNAPPPAQQQQQQNSSGWAPTQADAAFLDPHHSGRPEDEGVPAPRRSPSGVYGPSTKAGGNRPPGISMCSSCKATTSPEWRKGPSGKKELCNACGLRYARSRAKKEGQSLSQRKKKEKALNAARRDSATPPTPSTSTSTMYSSIRGNRSVSGESPTTSISTGPDVLYHHQQHAQGNSPSPSPQSTQNINFVHYSPSDSRVPPPLGLPHHPQQFYHRASPLSSFERGGGSGSGPGGDAGEEGRRGPGSTLV